jgi:hypothetical protein
MPDPDIDPLVTALAEDRAHAINQLIMDAQLAEAPSPGEQVQNVVNLSVADNTVGYLCYYLAVLVDTHFAQGLSVDIEPSPVRPHAPSFPRTG